MDMVFNESNRRITNVAFECIIGEGPHLSMSTRSLGPLRQTLYVTEFTWKFEGIETKRKSLGDTRKQFANPNWTLVFKDYMSIEDPDPNTSWRYNRSLVTHGSITISKEFKDRKPDDSDTMNHTYLETMLTTLLKRNRDVKDENIADLRRRYTDLLYLFPYIESD